jgi:ATP-dependent RNA helicase HelY
MVSRYLTQSEFMQLTGRAGRRGFDIEGNAIILGNNKYDSSLIYNYLNSSAEPIDSRLKIRYNTYACLLGNNNLNENLDRSFYNFLRLLDKKYNNYCITYTDSRFQRYLNYSKMLDRQEDKYKKNIISLEEYKDKCKNLRTKLKEFKCKSCKEIEQHKKHLENKLLNLHLPLKEQIQNVTNVLLHYKHLNKNGELTWSGKLLKDINAENELFILELVLAGIFDKLDYFELTYVLTSIMTETKKYTMKTNMKNKLSVKESLSKIRKILLELKNIESLYGIETVVDINKTFCDLAVCWVSGDSWEQICSKGLSDNYEGDFYRVLKRVVDCASQIKQLNNNYPLEENLLIQLDLLITYINRDLLTELE